MILQLGPGRLESLARGFEVPGDSLMMHSPRHAGIQADRPYPLIGMHRYASAFADGADADIAEIDVPSLLVRIVGTAAGQLGHGG